MPPPTPGRPDHADERSTLAGAPAEGGGQGEGRAPLAEAPGDVPETLPGSEGPDEPASSPGGERPEFLPGGEGPDGASAAGEGPEEAPERTSAVVREHLRGLLESLLFLSNEPMGVAELAGLAKADRKVVRELLAELHEFYRPRGLRLDEVAGGWMFRTNPAYGPFLRELTGQKPVKMTRAQLETLAIVA